MRLATSKKGGKTRKKRQKLQIDPENDGDESFIETTLRVHFFGSDGNHKLTFDEFTQFIGDFQREAIKAEFLEYSRGLDLIGDRDFASMLLRYTDLDEWEKIEYYRRLEQKLFDVKEESILFEEVEKFFSGNLHLYASHPQ